MGVKRRRPLGPRTSGSQGAGITIQEGRREEGCCEPRLQAPMLSHCPMRLDLQNANSKVPFFKKNFDISTTEH